MTRAILRHTLLERVGTRGVRLGPGASVTVREPGTATPIAAAMHDAITGGNVLANPLTADANGGILAYLDAAQFVDLYVVDGAVSRTVPAVAIGVGGGDSGIVVSDPVMLSAAQILDLLNTPVEILPAPGAGKVIWPSSWFTVYSFGTTVYNPNASLELLWNGISTDFGAGGSHIFQRALAGSESSIATDSMSISQSLLTNAEDCPLLLVGDSEIVKGLIVTTTKASGGSGYAIGDTGTINGNQSDATYEVDTVDGGGAVLTYVPHHGCGNRLSRSRKWCRHKPHERWRLRLHHQHRHRHARRRHARDHRHVSGGDAMSGPIILPPAPFSGLGYPDARGGMIEIRRPR